MSINLQTFNMIATNILLIGWLAQFLSTHTHGQTLTHLRTHTFSEKPLTARPQTKSPIIKAKGVCPSYSHTSNSFGWSVVTFTICLTAGSAPAAAAPADSASAVAFLLWFCSSFLCAPPDKSEGY